MSRITTTLVGLMLASTAAAHEGGCYGDNTCSTQHNQNQSQAQAQNTASRSTLHTTNNARYLSVRPVVTPSQPIVTPAADVSRMVSEECGPRMKIVNRAVQGLNNRALSSERVDLGFDQYVVPDEELPYRRVQLTEHITQLIGHRYVETTSAVTASTSGGFAVGGFGSSSGGSLGAHRGGALQRLVNTVRLVECVAYEIDMRPLKPRG